MNSEEFRPYLEAYNKYKPLNVDAFVDLKSKIRSSDPAFALWQALFEEYIEIVDLLKKTKQSGRI